MAELHNRRIHTESLVLDIGGDVGALILYTDPAMCNREIELSPQGSPSDRFHNQVHERQFNGRSVFAAVYPDVHTGTYDVWWDECMRAGEVKITGGAVTVLDWRT